MATLKPRVQKLRNGIPVIEVAQNSLASVTVTVFVKVGSRYEHAAINGASHFIEHLLFKGTRRRKTAQDITKELDRYGAAYNAFTSKDATSFYIKIDAQHGELAVDLLHDMLTHSRFDKKDIDRERGVIVEEINMYEDNPSSYMSDRLEQMMLSGNALGFDIAGPREVIKSVPAEDLIAYHKQYYIPSRMVVAVAGKVTPKLRAKLQATFGTLHEPAHPLDASFERFTVPEPREPQITYAHRKIEQVQLGMAFYGLAMSDARMNAMRLLSVMLGGSMSSRLFIEVREKRGLCYSIGSSHHAFEDTGLFSIMAGLDSARVEEALKAIWKELELLRTKKVSATELRHAKDQVRGRMMLSFEDSSNQADWYGHHYVFHGKIKTFEDRLRAIEKVTSTEILALAKEIFQANRLGVSVVGAMESEDALREMVHRVVR